MQASLERLHAEQRRARDLFYDVVLEQVSRIRPRQVSDVLSMVRSVWGETSQRNVYRALAHLREAGKIRKTDDGYLLTKVRQ